MSREISRLRLLFSLFFSSSIQSRCRPLQNSPTGGPCGQKGPITGKRFPLLVKGIKCRRNGQVTPEGLGKVAHRVELLQGDNENR